MGIFFGVILGAWWYQESLYKKIKDLKNENR